LVLLVRLVLLMMSKGGAKLKETFETPVTSEINRQLFSLLGREQKRRDENKSAIVPKVVSEITMYEAHELVTKLCSEWDLLPPWKGFKFSEYSIMVLLDFVYPQGRFGATDALHGILCSSDILDKHNREARQRFTPAWWAWAQESSRKTQAEWESKRNGEVNGSTEMETYAPILLYGNAAMLKASFFCGGLLLKKVVEQQSKSIRAPTEVS